MTRREFLKRIFSAGAGLVLLGEGTSLAAEDAPAKSRVAQAMRAAATKDLVPDPAVVREMVNAAVMKLSGKATPTEAWRQYVKPEDTVGIKINCLFGVGACTHPAVTQAVVEGCILAGVAPDRIIVWDRSDNDLAKCGYEINRGPGVRAFGVNNDWEDKPVMIHTCEGRLARLLTQTCTALINVPILKSHGISGVTLALKNHYGSFHNPWEAHDNACDPYLAHLNALPAIKDKTRLIVADALLPVAEGGPSAQPAHTWAHNTILAATDPVAVDYVGLRILDAQRAKTGLPSLETTGKAPSILTAAKMGLGVAEMERIELLDA